ncbi:hypothetical protein M407DRAFT_241378 [Tulasnella calospora MUT 4182]|uniref:DUF1776-domain-containing protein n=1 Tax=Tulasnella calospora MUT 4182 TaxID=1051891 RepID=A0A0C3QJI6_9AGAM|nr:hypothetical protein M407DRAFT_241378 [Tulasnella calospora MUT 4182]
MPTLQDVEDAIGALENYVAAQIPIITRGIQRLTDDLRRYGPPELPPLPEMPSIPLFASIPPPPPPVPSSPPQNLNDKVGGWVVSHRRGLVGAATVVGVGLAAGGWIYWSSKRIASAAAKAQARAKGAKEVVVLLGADSPLGHLVIQDLRANDYIVIASVSAPESVSEVERLGKGFVKALVLDPTDPSSTAPFLRSLQSTLSLKFPIAPGDPYAPCPPSEIPTLVSMISLLSLSPAGQPSTTDVGGSAASLPGDPPASIVDMSIPKEYLPHLVATHLTPLNIIQSLLPLFRTSNKKANVKPTIVVALPGGPESTGLVGQQAATAMSNSAMAKGLEILRREIALTPDVAGTRVVVIDVGKLAAGRTRPSRRPRRPTDPQRFADAVLRVVGGSQIFFGPHAPQRSLFANSLLSLSIAAGDWWRGNRFSVGAGAGTYSAASYLPLWILDPLILLPQRLIAYRDWMRQKTRNLREDVARERQRRREREREKEAQRELEENEGKQMVVVPKPRDRTTSQSSAASATGSGNGDAASGSPASVPSEVPDNASEPDSENGVPSAPASEPGGHHMGESWVMDVDAEGHASQTQA